MEWYSKDYENHGYNKLGEVCQEVENKSNILSLLAYSHQFIVQISTL